MNDSVDSLICVAAWKRLTIRPTTSATSNSGAESSSATYIAWCASVITDSGVMIQACQMGDFISNNLRNRTLTSDQTKLCASEPISNCHPSTSTNSISLNGSEIVAGETIIIPIDISTLATTMSMIRNGMKIVKPI